MEVLSKYYSQLDDIEKGLEDKAYQLIQNNEEGIIKMNTDNLLSGLTPFGSKINPKYSSTRYARAKNIFNPKPGIGTPDLNLTGAFHSEFYLSVKNRMLELQSSNEKSSFLEKKYGKENIYGISEKQNEVLNYEILLPELLEWVLKKLKI